MDNLRHRKVAKVRSWLARRPRYHVHFTPTAGQFAESVGATVRGGDRTLVRRGSHTGVRALEKAMLDYLDKRNESPKPFVWTADADLILGKVDDFVNVYLFRTLAKLHHQALVAGQLQNRFRFVLEELVKCLPHSIGNHVIVRDNNRAGIHTGIEEL